MQQKNISAAEGQQVAQITVQTLRSLRNEASFDLFWLKVNKIASDFGIGEPQFPRRRKVPRRYDDGQSEVSLMLRPIKSLYRQQYFEAIDLIVTCIEDRFNQPGYKTYQSLQSLLLKACMLVKVIYKVIDQDLLQSLQTHFNRFKVSCQHKFKFLLPGQLSLLSNVKRLMQLILVANAGY